MTPSKKKKVEAAKPEVLRVVRRFGMDAVWYILAKLKEQARLRKEVVRLQRVTRQRIAEIKAKL